MSFNLESGKSKEINETPEVKVDSEQLSETEKNAENFDDCSLNEVQDRKGNEVNAESLEEAEENYDDCEAKMKEEHPELTDEDDDFSDCGKETDGRYVAEVTYTTDGEISREEADAELQEAYNECEDPEDMQRLKENANENEHIEVHTAEVVERPENGEVTEELTEEEYEEAQKELEEAKENLEAQQEAAEEYQNDLENQINDYENEVPEGTENINNEASEKTESTDDEVSENMEAPKDSETEETADESDAVEETDGSDEETELSEDSESTDEDSEEVKANEDVESSEKQETLEARSEQVEEETRDTDGSSEISEDNLEETDGDSDSGEVEKVDTDELEQMNDDSKVETSKINEENVSEDVSQKVEDETDEKLSDESKEQIAEEAVKEIDREAADNTISSEEAEEIINEKVEEKVDAVEEQNDTIDKEIEDRADEIVEDEDLTEDEAKDQISEEVAEVTTDELSEKDVETIVEEKSEEIDDVIEKKKQEQEAVEVVEKTAEDLENQQVEQVNEKTEKSLQERIDGAFEKEEVSSWEINDLREENAAELQAKIEEKSAAEAELKDKFDEVLSKEKGSDEYRQSLQEYNALQDRKASLDEQIVSMKKQQDLLEKRSLKLREAQIQKGAEAVAASSATLAGVNALQERYDQTYYDTKPDATELASIRDDSCFIIKELSAEKAAIKQAMDAKMEEISVYVRSNNMERYDTAHDFHYKQLSAEYIAMKESYDRIGYSIVKLDENNKAITEHLGDEYVSMTELPPSSRISEVNEGTDIPGETDYFVDEAKATEVLSPFKQGNWEQLSIQEQKKAVEKLANYNAEILGIEDKPRIIYYNDENPCRFGRYSAKQNAIYINEYNMHNAAETADTISHEYRHKYQHERAAKLETERDLEYKDGFDNYIRAEDDYQSYKEQLVESDARLYAQAVKDKIASYSETSNETVGDSDYVENNNLGVDYTKLNPEKGAVFEKVSVDDLPEDFEQKDKYNYREVLEARELDELRAVAGAHYENGKAVWGKLGIQELEAYKEHNDIENGHIEKVRVKSLEAADALEAHFVQNNYGGLYSSNIDRRTVEVMSIYHDTGMDGNIQAENYEAERQAYLSDESIRENYVNAAVAKKEKEAMEAGEPFDRVAEEIKANEKFEKEDFENHFRPNHSIESAIHALRDRESINDLNVNTDEVALGCLVHSKSNSGLRSIASEDDWRTAVARLQDKVDEFNKKHSDEQIYFDSSFLVNKDGSFNQEKLAEMRSEAIVLRIGDANGHDSNSRISQTGKSIEFSLEEKNVKEKLPSDFENGDYEAYFLEVQAADVKVDGTELDNGNDPKGVSRMFAVGEGNFKSLNCKVAEDGTIKQTFELCDGNAFPLSTQHCIEERLGEYKTAQPMSYTPVVKLGGNCSDKTYQSYLDFADRIERDYDVRMEVER